MNVFDRAIQKQQPIPVLATTTLPHRAVYFALNVEPILRMDPLKKSRKSGLFPFVVEPKYLEKLE
jgi:hypothetical protein